MTAAEKPERQSGTYRGMAIDWDFVRGAIWAACGVVLVLGCLGAAVYFLATGIWALMAG